MGHMRRQQKHYSRRHMIELSQGTELLPHMSSLLRGRFESSAQLVPSMQSTPGCRKPKHLLTEGASGSLAWSTPQSRPPVKIGKAPRTRTNLQPAPAAPVLVLMSGKVVPAHSQLQLPGDMGLGGTRSVL